MSTGALVFMLTAWTLVIGLTGWSFYRLLRADSRGDKLPPPGTSL